MQKTRKQVYRLKDIVDIYGLSRSTIYRAMANGSFPRQIKLLTDSDTHGAVGWDADLIQAWYASRLLHAM